MVNKWASHFEDWRRRGFQNIVWLVCWMGWNPVELQQPASVLLNLGNCDPESFSRGISGRAYSCGIALEGVIALQTTPSHSTHILTDHRTLLRGSYTRKSFAYSKELYWKKKWSWRGSFVFFPPSEVKSSGIWSYGIWGKSWFFQRFEESRIQSYSIKFWYFRPAEAMEILGCGASRAGWSVMLSGYMEWNLWPQFDQKRCQHMLENPTCRTGNAYQGGIVLQGGHRTPGVASYPM